MLFDQNIVKHMPAAKQRLDKHLPSEPDSE
jgi:hypothetical protein